jgi:hypothetical protein
VATSNQMKDWHEFLTVISTYDAGVEKTFQLTPKERGLVHALLSSPPATLSENQVSTLSHLQQRWTTFRGSLK